MQPSIDVTRRPGLAWQHAYDWLAVRLYAAAEPVACSAGTAQHLAELARRLPSMPFLTAGAAMRAKVAAALGLAEIRLAESASTLNTLGLVEPTAGDLALLDQVRPGGRLYVVGGGELARFLADRQDGAPLLTRRVLLRMARAAGFVPVERLYVQPPAAVAQHYAGELALRAGRRAARDRRHFAMRRDMVTDNPAAGPAALVCLTLERLS
jgi:hypothetical protein